MLAGTLLTVVALAVLLVAEAREDARLQRIVKPIASTGFIVVALAGGAMATGYGRLILLALACSFAGDVCLLSRTRRAFVAGLTAFLLGHVAFATAFWWQGLSPGWVATGAMLLTIPALLIRRWLTPYVPSNLRGPVDAYIVVITVMVATAIGALGAGGGGTIVVGAIAFYLSDLSVAKDRFIQRELATRLWGLPMYYAAQLLLASTVAASG